MFPLENLWKSPAVPFACFLEKPLPPLSLLLSSSFFSFSFSFSSLSVCQFFLFLFLKKRQKKGEPNK